MRALLAADSRSDRREPVPRRRPSQDVGAPARREGRAYVDAPRATRHARGRATGAGPAAGARRRPTRTTGTIVTDRPNVMWGTDATATVTLRRGAGHDLRGHRSLHRRVRGHSRRASTAPLRSARSRCGKASATTSAAWPAASPPACACVTTTAACTERRLPERDRVSRHDVVARIRSPARRQRLHRTVLSDSQGAVPVGSALRRPRGPPTGAAARSRRRITARG